MRWGVCYSCGDTIGPWTLLKGRWLCDSCYEGEMYEKGDSKGDDVSETEGAEGVSGPAQEAMG